MRSDTPRRAAISLCVLAAITSSAAATPAPAVTQARLVQQKQESKQEPKESAAQRLERAVLVDESEHDAARAVELYTSVGHDDSAPKELRAKAWLRCGKAFRRLGKDDDAKKAFESAAALEGDAAEEAKRIVSGRDEEEERTLEHVRSALGELSGVFSPDYTKIGEYRPFSELVWLGDAAVGAIADDLAPPFRGGEPQRAAVETLALVEIGGPKAAAALRVGLTNDDPLYQRALLERLVHASTDQLGKEPVRTELLALLHQKDPRIRVLALERLARVLTNAEIAALVHDDNEDVRAAAVWKFRGENQGNVSAYSDVVLDAFEAATSDRSKKVRTSACNALESGLLLHNDRGRRLFLSLLERDELFEDVNNDWATKVVNRSSYEVRSPPPAARLLEVARKLGPFHDPAPNSTRSLDQRRWAFLNFVTRCCDAGGNTPAPSDRWSKADRPALWDMLRLGVWETATWIGARCGPEDAVGVAEALADFGSASVLANYLHDSAPSLAAGDKSRLLAAMTRLFDSIESSMAGQPFQSRARDGELVNLSTILVALDTDEADLALLDRAAKTMAPSSAIDLLLQRPRSAAPAVLAGLLVVEPVGTWSDTQGSRILRSRIVRRLAKQHAPELLAALPRAYELGLEPIQESNETQQNGGVRGIAEVLFTIRSRSSRQWSPAFDAAQLVPAFEACAKGNSYAFWEDVNLGFATIAQEPRDATRDQLLRVVGEEVAHCPEVAPRTDEHGRPPLVNADSSGGSLRRSLVQAWLKFHGLDWEKFVLGHFDESDLQPVLVASMPSIPPSLADRVLALLPTLSETSAWNVVSCCAKSDDPKLREKTFDFLHDRAVNTRLFALRFVFERFRDRALDATAPLAADPDGRVRAELMRQLGETFDRRVIPQLIEALRDGDGTVRDAAKQSLEKIQFYVENKERWTKLLEGSGLDASDAAAALLKQAAAAQPKATRLAAIESLGTLGVAETLPLLIQFMGDADPDVAAAAKAAVDRVNRRAVEKDGTHKESASGH